MTTRRLFPPLCPIGLVRRTAGSICAILVVLVVLQQSTLAASRKPVKARHAMVVSADSLASAAGIEILRQGGNAVDAAVAMGFTLAVTYPEAGNLGGGGFMLIRMANGDAVMIDFRERAPLAATKTMYLDGQGNPVGGKSELGLLAAGVPGTVAGLLKALGSYGTMGRGRVMQRAIDLARNGFAVNENLALRLKEDVRGLGMFASTVRAFFRKGKPLGEGMVLKQTDLAGTLRAIRARGRSGFYEGKVADRIVRGMKREGGIVTHRDLALYQPVEREPVKGSYRGYEILSASPPSGGGIILLQMLNILERFDLAAAGHNSSRMIHLLASAAQFAYADRAEYLGDPDFVTVPVDELISKRNAEQRASAIDTGRATPSSEVGHRIPPRREGQQTTHFCVVDGLGNAVSVTMTLNDYFGCKAVVDGAGFFLNNEMDDFATKPGHPDMYGLVSGEANAIAPGKRMASSMTPTIVLKNGHPLLLVGGRGGSRIPTSVVQVILNVLDFRMNIQEAVDAPRVHYQWLPDEILHDRIGIPKDVTASLCRIGYRVGKPEEFLGRVQAILIDKGHRWIYGGPDPRENGVALGY